MSASVSNTYESAHDPLCPFHMLSPKPYAIAMWSCQCALIDRVREDERPLHYGLGYKNGYSIARRDAVETVKADFTARIMREAGQGDRDGLLGGLIYGRDKAVAAIEAIDNTQQPKPTTLRGTT